MPKLFIEDLIISGKKILMRVDFNVPLDSEGHVADATRIEAALPSILYVLKQGGALILMSHLGRPRNETHPELSLKPVAKILAILLDPYPVTLAPNCIGEGVLECIDRLKPGEILLLENLRFHRAEEYPEEDPLFAKTLASYGDDYVNDAFGTAHRKHSSTYTIAQYFPNRAAAGYLMAKEIRFLGELLQNPQRPFYGMIGGAKISTKMGVVESLLKKVDCLLIGGAMAYTFLKAQGVAIGNSPFEEEYLPEAQRLLQQYGSKILLPIDCIAAAICDETAPTKVVSYKEGLDKTDSGFDIGPQTIKLYQERLQDGKTILWNGPFGVYELDCFAKGTTQLARFIASLSADTVIGGGDLIAAVKKAGVSDRITHISTGGGAILEYIEFGTLPGIEALSDK